jgi:N-acetylglucosamine kinase-like BadF-type ATPase
MATDHPDRIFLGIDGGGTQTRAALVDEAGTILGTGRSGPSNYQSVGTESARENIRLAAEQAWSAAGRTFRQVDAAFLGMAGVISDTDRATIADMADRLGLAPRERTGIDHDLRTALAGGLGGREGIVLIVGTGSSCYGRRRDGTSWRAGGWGHLLDDLGGGYWLGLQGLIAITRAADGRGAQTSLSDRLMNALGLSDIQEILYVVHQRFGRSEIAALAPQILAAAEEGDNAAWEILRLGTEELAKMVQAVAQSLGWINDNVEGVMIGGLTESPVYAAEITSTIGKRAHNVQLKDPILPPVLGAALLAMEIGGVDGANVVEMLRQGREMFEER